ncbi:hypothetical protein EH223_04595 [candidate division KSB1 bacterium]|nr:MAG: hypothetical protein EH223_04595 [candidate division KSB1 bacterium]
MASPAHKRRCWKKTKLAFPIFTELCRAMRHLLHRMVNCPIILTPMVDMKRRSCSYDCSNTLKILAHWSRLS